MSADNSISPESQTTEVRRLADLTVPEVAAFLKAIDQDFIPPLSTRIKLEDYAAKLVDKAVLVGAKWHGRLVGLVAFYCNDLATRRAYVTCLGVAAEARGRGLGVTLIRQAMAVSHAAGMEVMDLQIDGDRPSLLAFYQRFGFRIMETHTRYGGFPAHLLRASLPEGVGSARTQVTA